MWSLAQVAGAGLATPPAANIFDELAFAASITGAAVGNAVFTFGVPFVSFDHVWGAIFTALCADAAMAAVQRPETRQRLSKLFCCCGNTRKRKAQSS
jgi:hypothetical protein